MIKTATLTYGPIQVLPTIVFTSIKIELLTSAGVVNKTMTALASAQTATIDVPDGTGWKLRITNLDQNLTAIGPAVLSAPFDVVSLVTIQVVTGVILS